MVALEKCHDLDLLERVDEPGAVCPAVPGFFYATDTRSTPHRHPTDTPSTPHLSTIFPQSFRGLSTSFPPMKPPTKWGGAVRVSARCTEAAPGQAPRQRGTTPPPTQREARRRLSRGATRRRSPQTAQTGKRTEPQGQAKNTTAQRRHRAGNGLSRQGRRTRGGRAPLPKPSELKRQRSERTRTGAARQSVCDNGKGTPYL